MEVQIMYNYSVNQFYDGTAFRVLAQYPAESLPYLAACNDLKKNAIAIGITNFSTLLKAYQRDLANNSNTAATVNQTNFSAQPITLTVGNYIADDTGIFLQDGTAIFPHPIMPVARLKNADTHTYLLKLAFRRGSEPWKEIIVDRGTLATPNKIIELANHGVSVTSENARQLVKYLSKVEDMNLDILPVITSISRLGAIPNVGFAPYVDGLVYDGSGNYDRLFAAVSQKGSFDQWLSVAAEVRKMSKAANIMLAASFASVLLAPLNCLPFFCHLWSVESGNGKTVALMVAASVWGNPVAGEYVKSFDATIVGMEKTAAFLNQLPFCVDELQLNRDSRGQKMFDVYRLAQGAGRTRGNKFGGVDTTTSWCNAILTTGESPLVKANEGAGAVNRVIEIEAEPGKPVVQDGHRIVAMIRQNFGFAGREFVSKLYQPGIIDSLDGAYEALVERFLQYNTSDKQAASAAVIVLADQLFCTWMLPGESVLTVEELAPYLAAAKAISTGERAYQYIYNWVAEHYGQLESSYRDCYGKVFKANKLNYAFITTNAFRSALEEGGFSPEATLSYLKAQNLLRRSAKNVQAMRKINEVTAKGYEILLPPECSE